MAWTGFVSETADGTGGYALHFRELNEKADFALDLSSVFGAATFSDAAVIVGRGTFVVGRGASRLVGLVIPGIAYSKDWPSAAISSCAIGEGCVYVTADGADGFAVYELYGPAAFREVARRRMILTGTGPSVGRGSSQF